jgi:hypothetical protein
VRTFEIFLEPARLLIWRLRKPFFAIRLFGGLYEFVVADEILPIVMEQAATAAHHYFCGFLHVDLKQF